MLIILFIPPPFFITQHTRTISLSFNLFIKLVLSLYFRISLRSATFQFSSSGKHLTLRNENLRIPGDKLIVTLCKDSPKNNQFISSM